MNHKKMSSFIISKEFHKNKPYIVNKYKHRSLHSTYLASDLSP